MLKQLKMVKKINTALGIKNDSFKIKIGTIDKKNPNAVYVNIGAFITPMELRDSYTNDFISFQKDTKRKMLEIIAKNPICEKNTIIIVDIAESRITMNKKSYLDIQIFLKPTSETLSRVKKSFKTLSNEINDNYIQPFILPYIKDEINKCQFCLSKVK